MVKVELTGYFTWPLVRRSCISLRVQSLVHPGTAILHPLYSHKWTPEPIWSWFTATSGALIVCAGLKCRSVSTRFTVPLNVLQHKKREFTSNCIDLVSMWSPVTVQENILWNLIYQQHLDSLSLCDQILRPQILNGCSLYYTTLQFFRAIFISSYSTTNKMQLFLKLSIFVKRSTCVPLW